MSMLFDIGANVGDYTIANYYKYDKIICIDAQPDMCKILSNKFPKDKCTIVHALITDEPDAKFYKNNQWGNGGISTCSDYWRLESRFAYMPESAWEYIPNIPVKKLDDLIKEYGEPSFIKIDVEGSELNVIRTLSKYVCPIAFEFAEELLDDIIATLQILENLGYNRYHVQYDDVYTYCPNDDQYNNLENIINYMKLNFIPDRKEKWGMIWSKKI